MAILRLLFRQPILRLPQFFRFLKSYIYLYMPISPKVLLLAMVWLLNCALLLGQGEARFWYYDAGIALDFASGSPLSLNNSVMGDGQSAAAISNPCGDLLFYVGSDTAWNANHVPLQNGFGLSYSVIHRLIVPHPGNSNQYFIIGGGSMGSVEYSLVDLSAAGGTGSVIQKNVGFHFANTVFDQRKLAGVIHANETDYWIAIIEYPTDIIYTYKITTAGLVPTPLTSYVGPITNGQNNNAYSAQTKFSPDGRRLATAASLDCKVMVMEFDNATGQFANMITLQSPPTTLGPGVTGLEFSQDGEKLYWTYYAAFPANPGIRQVDLSVWNAAAMAASMVQIGFSNSFYGNGGMQLANNGKIYLSRAGASTNVPPPLNWHYIDAINAPNLSGAASSFQNQALLTFPNYNKIYTPTILANFLRPWEVETSTANGQLTQTACEGDSLHFGLTYYSYYNQTDSILWDFGDGTALSSALQLDRSYDSTGIFPITALVYRGCTTPDTLRDTVTIFPTPIAELGADTTLCQGQALLLSAGTKPGISYLWSDNSSGQTLIANSPGWVWLEASSVCGTVRDSLYLDYDSLFVLNLGPPDTLLCPGQSLLLAAPTAAEKYLWQDGSTGAQFQVPSSQAAGDFLWYWVEASNACDTLRDSISVGRERVPTLNLGADTLLCDATTLNLDATFDSPGTVYRWQDGSVASGFQVNGSQAPGSQGLYWVEVANHCGSATDSILIDFQQAPVVDIGPADTLLCDQATLQLSAAFPGATYRWQDGSTASEFQVNGAPVTGSQAVYSVAVTTLCGTASDEIFVQFAQTPVIELGPDTALCEGEIVLMDATFPGAAYEWKDGSTDPMMLAMESGLYTVSLSTLCGQVGDSRQIDFFAPPMVDLGPDTLLCSNRPLSFDFRDIQATFLWQDGSQLPVYQTREAGVVTVLVENACSSDRDTLIIERENCDCFLFVPSAFTPNDDGYNDLFSLGYTCNFESFELQIFNRWGQRVFVTQDPAESWNGSSAGFSQREGVYAYLVNYRYKAKGGSTERQESGFVTIWR